MGRDGGVQPVEKLLMLVGVFHFPTDYGIDVGELARELEAREFDSLFVCEHTHIPVSRRTPFPGGGELPKALLAHARPLRWASIRCGGYANPSSRYWDRARAAARSNCHS